MPSQKPSHPQRFWLAAIAAAWLVDFLFWGKSAGISFPIFVIVVLLAGFALLYGEKARPARSAFVLAGIIMALAVVPFARSAPFPRALNIMLALSSLGLLVLTLRSGSWYRFRLLDFISGGFELFFAALTRGAGLRLLPPADADGKSRSFWRPALPVIRGFIMAAPIVIVLGALLASADLVFEDQLLSLLRVFDLDRLPETLFRLVYILILAYIFAGLLVYSVLPDPILRGIGRADRLPEAGVLPEEEPAVNSEEPSVPVPPASQAGDAAPTMVPGILGMPEAVVILGSINLLFAFFVGVQFRYFFGGQANITAAGYTYAEYARRGFFELVMVAVISLLVVVLLGALTRIRGLAQRRLFTGLTTLLVGLVLVMLVSAFQRLLLYEAVYGFTRQRSYTHIFIPWLAFLLVGVILLQWLRLEQFFSGLLILTGFGFALTLGLVNVDAWIVRQNLERARLDAGAGFDGPYLLTLSEDAIPALVDEFKRSGQSAEVHDTLGAVLSCAANSAAQPAAGPWQSFHLARAAATSALASVDLSDYPVRSSYSVPDHVLLPSGQFDCYPSFIMD